MSIWKTLKEMVFGAPLRNQFEQMMVDEAAKAMPAPVNDQITDSVTQAAPAKPKRVRKPKAEATPATAPAPKSKKPVAKKKK